MSQYADLATPDPEYAALFAQMPRRSPTQDIQLIRERVNKFFISITKEHFRQYLPEESQYRVEDHQVPTSVGTTIVRTLTPAPLKGKESMFPCLFFIHGGGFTAGSVEMDDFRLRIVCVELQIAIILAEYRLAPENPFPTSLNDCYNSLKWAVEHAQKFGASLAKGFLIGGTSAGANLVATLVHRARDDAFFRDTPLTGQVLQMPLVVHPDAYPEKFKPELLSISIEEQNDMTILTKTMVYDMYRHLRAPPFDPEVSPLLYPSHEGLPSTFVQVAGLDPLRDEGLLYEKVLRAAGVKTKLIVYPGVPHGFNLSFPTALKASRKFEDDLKIGLEWLLNGAA
ncbi:hypothetical protein EW146_g1770 [Bondarzewia mesenterica]|uniref:Alpha/beta hydrolase fold-3 domain-containing protein n=1 Tax=Bondarzewia mesenterica TaxID=1095465 RepID=A0A4S4M2T9_9AGAM|nr:hypothetical protein EW146_g1770 [Bondarzewia mesenterica]